uniref:Protein kinase-like domain, concanavalin A-like lectin/glucanase domain protein n=1 Tax=Tanacetum cinerariifolium TaxID=118510 RepID=A0A6L2NXN8_TANCI|nr:protein kinase-like domain, concanavalin A-like lectin/glucanase domain protein [Tanacetum cinerariifolium]
MENVNPSTPPEPKSFRNKKVREINALLKSLNLISPPLKRDPSCLEGNVGFIELFKEYDIRDFSEEEVEEEEDIVEIEELEVISSVIDHCLSQVVLGKTFANMTYDTSLRIVKFTNGVGEVAYKMPHKIEQFQSLFNIEKEHKQSSYFRNEEDKKRGEDYVMKKIFGFYKECLELGPEYKTNNNEGSSVSEERVTLWRRRQNFPLTLSGSYSDVVTMFYDGVTNADSKNHLEDLMG